MPEGDTLRHAAAALAPALEGESLTEVWFAKLRGVKPRLGERIETVRAVGKHLLIDFAGGLTLDTHLGMTGSWRVQSADAALPRSPKLRVVLGVAKARALCFAAPTIQTYARTRLVTPVSHLGPDLSDDEVDWSLVAERMAAIAPTTRVCEALLEQSIACGIGNVFKSEALFVAGVHPFIPMGALDEAARLRLWQVAHRQLVTNRDRPRRSTTPSGELYVYGRFGLPCRVCQTPIDFDAGGRSTYWCPRCQLAAGARR